MNQPLSKLIGAALCALIGASCTMLDTESERFACQTDADCVTGYLCDQGVCLPEAQVSKDPCEGRETAEECVGRGEPDAEHSTFTVAPASVAADGASVATLTVTLNDRFDTPVAAEAVTLTVDGEGHVLTPTEGTTDDEGVFTATLTSSVVGPREVLASFEGGSLTAVVTFTAGAPDLELSTLTVSTPAVLANGAAQATLTATLLDADSHPVSGVDVTFAATGDNNTLTVVAGTTDETGVATAQLRSTTAEAKSLTASFGSPAQSLEAVVTFIPSAPSSTDSLFVASPTTLVADGVATTTLTATIIDGYANPIPNLEVAFASSNEQDSLSLTTGTTDADGVVTLTATSTRSGVKTYTATFGDALTRTVEVTFLPGAPDAAKSTFKATPSSVAADGTTAATLSATINDANGNPIPDVVVAFATTGDAQLSGPEAISDANGVASVTTTSSQAGVVTFTASFGPSLKRSLNVTFLAGQPSAANSTFTSDGNSAEADNRQELTFTATVKDSQGNILSGVPVEFTATGSGNTFTPASAQTDANGKAVTTLKSSKAEPKKVTATFSDVTKAVNVTFRAGRPVTSGSKLVASKGTATADGTDSVTFTVTLRDALGNVAANEVVDFTVTGSDNTLVPARATSSVEGIATTTLTATKAEPKNVTATFGDAQTLNASATFKAGPADTTTTSLKTSASSVAANGTSAATVTATVRDLHGNPLVGLPLSFSVSGEGAVPPAAVVSTKENGVAVLEVRATMPGLKTVQISLPTFTKSVDITFTCTKDVQCDDGLSCSGIEACIAGACVAGTPVGDGERCVRPAGTNGVCQRNICAEPDYEWAAWPIPVDAPGSDQYTLTEETALDRVTGLMWQRGSSPTPMNYSDALTYCADLVLASHDDWRLPTVIEYTSIVQAGADRAIDDSVFLRPDDYWLATRFAKDATDQSWFVDTGGSEVFFGQSYNMNSQSVRCVR